MLATFTANLAAFLTVERMQAPVQSLDQLARQSRINYTVGNFHIHSANNFALFLLRNFKIFQCPRRIPISISST